MKKIIVLAVGMLLLSSCAIKNHGDFAEQRKYPETYDVYEDAELLDKATKKNTSIKINTHTQRLMLLVDGKVAYDAPATTGSKHKKDINDGAFADKETPNGTFKIVQKLEKKRSTLYGDIIKDGEVVYTGERLKYKKPYDKFEGVSMPYWMRFNKSIGMHESEAISRYPGSNGCVRLPMESVKKVYSLVKVGTKVKVVSEGKVDIVNAEDLDSAKEGKKEE